MTELPSSNPQVFTTAFDLITHIERQRDFSERTFGPGLRTEGVSDHIRKELLEIADSPRDLSEWVDVILLALDGAWRAGYTPIEICEAIGRKQRKNEMRKWPDWRTAPLGKAIEHDRAADETAAVLQMPPEWKPGTTQPKEHYFSETEPVHAAFDHSTSWCGLTLTTYMASTVRPSEATCPTCLKQLRASENGDGGI